MTNLAEWSALHDPLEHLLGYQMRRISLRYLTKLTERLDALRFKVTEATIMMFVGANPGCSQSEISRMLGVQRTNMVPTVSGLVSRGLVHRVAADGRTNSLRLTPAGIAARSELEILLTEIDRDFFEILSTDQQNNLKGLHDILRLDRKYL